MVAFHSKEKGFLLVVVLWLLLTGVLIVSYLSSWVTNALEQRFVEAERTQFVVDAHTTRSALLYLLSTERMTVAGVSTGFTPLDRSEMDGEGNWDTSALGNEIRLDNRVYKGAGDVVFSLQDQRGLININYGSDALIESFLGAHNIDFEQRNALVDKLRDYIDEDELYRLNGAEAAQYRQQGKPGPRNSELLSTLELRNVLGWSQEELPIPDRIFMTFFSTVRNAQLNLNTAPEEVLQTLPGVSVKNARKIVELRQQKAFESRTMLASQLGDIPAEVLDAYVLFPSPYVGMTIWQPGYEGMREYFGIKLKSLEPGGKPWSITESFRFPYEKASDVGQDKKRPAVLSAAQALFN